MLPHFRRCWRCEILGLGVRLFQSSNASERADHGSARKVVYATTVGESIPNGGQTLGVSGTSDVVGLLYSTVWKVRSKVRGFHVAFQSMNPI